MTLMRKVSAIHDAPTPLQKARAMETALEALEAALGKPGDALLKVDGATGSMSAKLAKIAGSIAKIQENDRRNAANLQLSRERKPAR